MESYQNQSGAQQSHQQLDQYGNPVPIATGAYVAPVMAGHHTEGGGLSGMLHRSGSSSSSSSEDDGLGGRRRKKKGITEKIKEKMPGHHGSHQTPTTTVYDTTGTGTGGIAGVQHEKKGMLEKIKEKLPGGHH
ncbi:unnamed protein product [Arabis nemorensis]|uniref:Dehydrin n=1 Tax=Arabis nemorensis TaxID=586526 RepID=A0A565BVA9_9BRAS|nr:unnamed protein product [Arabis nemorensis]